MQTASDMGSTCDLPQNTDANTQWSATKVTQFLDSILSQRGSGKMGSIQMVCTLLASTTPTGPESSDTHDSTQARHMKWSKYGANLKLTARQSGGQVC